MNKSSVSIPYLIAWILGIITLGIIVYFIYNHIAGSSLDCSNCEAKLTAWCSTCFRTFGYSNWNGPNMMSSELSECVTKCGLLSSPHNYCDDASLDFCKAYIGF